mmetsp:Transcript_42962/g.114990  ORF Transcript_42962/g.114990 Transcript_42962/m.114990 type:complete len:325 (-) Transcript_42962:8-982(-)
MRTLRRLAQRHEPLQCIHQATVLGLSLLRALRGPIPHELPQDRSHLNAVPLLDHVRRRDLREAPRVFVAAHEHRQELRVELGAAPHVLKERICHDRHEEGPVVRVLRGFELFLLPLDLTGRVCAVVHQRIAHICVVLHVLRIATLTVVFVVVLRLAVVVVVLIVGHALADTFRHALATVFATRPKALAGRQLGRHRRAGGAEARQGAVWVCAVPVASGGLRVPRPWRTAGAHSRKHVACRQRHPGLRHLRHHARLHWRLPLPSALRWRLRRRLGGRRSCCWAWRARSTASTSTTSAACPPLLPHVEPNPRGNADGSIGFRRFCF